jgi:membrane protein DedA with SNARE-associated domain
MANYDEENMGMDPEVKRYFRKIMSSFSTGLLWMLITSTAGFYFDLAIIHEEVRWYNLAFYLFFLVTLVLFVWYLYKTWKD